MNLTACRCLGLRTTVKGCEVSTYLLEYAYVLWYLGASDNPEDPRVPNVYDIRRVNVSSQILATNSYSATAVGQVSIVTLYYVPPCA